MLKKCFLSFVLALVSFNGIGQDTDVFRFVKPNKKSVKIKFKLINNLIVIPMQLNGVELSFLLDTGVDKTLLITIGSEDSLYLSKTKKINIRGLGDQDKFDAYQSKGNVLEAKGIENTNHEIYFIIDKDNLLTSRLGMPINGIIGNSLFRDFIVKIDYKRKYIRLYDPSQFTKKLRSYEVLPLQFYRGKPFVGLDAKDESISRTRLNFLLDTGSGASFWLLENEFIGLPELYFEDILGYGLGTSIEGKRSRVDQISFGKNTFYNPSVAYPNVSQILAIEQNVIRDGTVGAEILRRFKLYIDYPNKRLFFKANKDIKDPFNYDMSGLLLTFDGVKIVEEMKRVSMNSKQNDQDPTANYFTNFIVTVGIKPKVVIQEVRPNSPAAEVGIKVGDELLKIEGKAAYLLELEEIQDILAEEEGKQIRLTILRNGREIKKRFVLRDRFADMLKESVE